MKYFNKLSIHKKILIGIMLISACVTTVVTAVSFYIDYEDELAIQSKTFDQISKLLVPAMSGPLWDLDHGTVKAHVESLSTIRDVVSARLLDSSANEVSHFSNPELEQSVDLHFSFPVLYLDKFTDTHKQIGVLEIKATRKFIHDRLWKKFWVFFLSQFFKTALMSALIFALVLSQVTKRILALRKHIALFEKSSFENWKELPESSISQQEDEISDLIKAYNRQLREISKLNLENRRLILSQGEEIDRQRQQAVESARLVSVGVLASGIAHEINNPLAVVSLSTKNLRRNLEKGADPAELYRLIDKIEKTVLRIARIISAMKLTVHDGSKEPLRPHLLSQMIETTLSLCESRFHDRGVRISYDLALSADRSVLCRETQFVQTLTNLLNNAFDACVETKDPWIELSVVEGPAGRVRLYVADSGSGVSPEIAEKIFTPFFTTKPVGQGTGLGLSLAKKYMQDNGGDLLLLKDCANTTFVMELLAAPPKRMIA